MQERFVLIVGDKFSQFAVGKDALTLSQLNGLLKLPDFLAPRVERMVLVPGQGLGDADIEAILAAASDTPNGQQFNLELLRNQPKRAAARTSHKRCPENTLISEPRWISEDLYEMHLLIDEKCELMRDHQTGQHLQGMVLLEAARQSFLAVTEAFYLPQDGTKFYFVINELSARYSRFAFPVDARIRYKITSRDLTNLSRRRFTADIAVEQCGMTTALFVADFTVFENQRIETREKSLAYDVIDHHFSALATARSPNSPETIA